MMSLLSLCADAGQACNTQPKHPSCLSIPHPRARLLNEMPKVLWQRLMFGAHSKHRVSGMQGHPDSPVLEKVTVCCLTCYPVGRQTKWCSRPRAHSPGDVSACYVARTP